MRDYENALACEQALSLSLRFPFLSSHSRLLSRADHAWLLASLPNRELARKLRNLAWPTRRIWDRLCFKKNYILNIARFGLCRFITWCRFKQFSLKCIWWHGRGIVHFVWNSIKLFKRWNWFWSDANVLLLAHMWLRNISSRKRLNHLAELGRLVPVSELSLLALLFLWFLMW